MGLLMLAAFGQRLIADLFAQLDHGVKNRLRPGWTSGEIEVDRDQFVHTTHCRGGVGTEHSAGDGAGSHGDHIFGLRHLLVQTNQGRGHLHGHRAGHNQKIGLAW